MSPNAVPMTAIERARLAYEDMKRRQHSVEVQRRARERSRNIMLAATVATTLAIVAGIAIYNGGGPESLRATAHEVRGDRTRTSEARTGAVRSYVKGNTCRELQFNNDSGTFTGGSLVACVPGEGRREGLRAEPGVPKGLRMNSIRDGFTR